MEKIEDNCAHEIRNSLLGIELEFKHIRLGMKRIEQYMKRMEETVQEEKARLESLPVLVRPTIQGTIRSDPEGNGHFGAPRGNHKHQGTDYVVTPTDAVMSPIDGKIIRSGYAYRGDFDYRLCEIRADGSIEIKLMYMIVFPSLIGQAVYQGQVIGAAQDVSLKYSPEMIPHIHAEVRIDDKLYDPEKMMA